MQMESINLNVIRKSKKQSESKKNNKKKNIFQRNAVKSQRNAN